jgi:protoheme IX farnesyltransferase
VLAASATLFYVFVYTLWLKRTTTQNIVIGGAAGCMPVLVGWAAVANSLAWAPIVLFLVIFYWTPPHFWALAIKYRDDYANAEVPMLPAVVSLEATSRRILLYTAILIPLTLVFSPVADMGAIYLGSALVLGAVFVAFALAVRRDPSERTAMRLFSYSITYLTLLFGSIVIDVVV